MHRLNFGDDLDPVRDTGCREKLVIPQPTGTESPMSDRIRSRRVFAGAVAAVLAFGTLGLGAAAAQAATDPSLTPDPSTIGVGETSTITASGLGGLEFAGFGMNGPDGGSFTETGTADYDAPATDGSATATFTATAPGTYTIDITDGETPLAETTVTVTDDVATPTVTAESTTIDVGGSTTITASGLGEIANAEFGLDASSGATFTESGTSSYAAPVTNGAATATFTATEPGEYTVDVTDGETPLAGTTVTVRAAETPTPTLTPTPTPTPTPADGGNALMWIVIAIVAVVVIAGVIVWIVVAQRRRANKTTA
jgi:hypothetical protein